MCAHVGVHVYVHVEGSGSSLLGVLAARPKDPSSSSRTHTSAHNWAHTQKIFKNFKNKQTKEPQKTQ